MLYSIALLQTNTPETRGAPSRPMERSTHLHPAARRLSAHPFVRRLSSRLREDGAKGAARFAVERVRAQLYEQKRHLVVVKDLREIAVPLRRGNVRLEELEQRHLASLSALNREREDRTGDQRFAGDLADGYACFVVVKDEQPIGFYWWVDGEMKPHREMSQVALGVTLRAGDVYGTDFYVAEAHRAGGTAADVLYQVETTLHERGFERLWGTVEDVNRSARWSYAARGYKEQWVVVGTRRLRRWRHHMEPINAERAGG
jgi:GNAT superfamily N-acetyltransferase